MASQEQSATTGDSATDAASNSHASPHPPSASDTKSRRVYVGNLAWSVSWQDLKDTFRSHGLTVVRANVLTTYDGRSKGCAIVELATPEEAATAVEQLQDTELKGRQIFVREDREDQAANSAGGTGGGDQSHRVYVGNLSWDVAWQDLKDHMKQAGDVVHVDIMLDHHTGRSKGCGLVEFADRTGAEHAIATLSNTELKGRTIFVREDREHTHKAGQASLANKQSNPSVYVWNLATETSWQDLKDHMRKAGNVDSATIFNNHQDDGSNAGIVVYQRPQDAARAIRELQGTMLHDKPLHLRMDRMHSGATSRNAGPGRGGFHRDAGRGRGGRGRGGERDEVGYAVTVTNLSDETDWRQLKDHFRQCGNVRRAEVIASSQGEGTTGTIIFSNKRDAETAVEKLHGSNLQGSDIEVYLR